MSAESNEPKYPVLDDIDVPEKVIENWQVTIDMLAEIAGVPAALIMRVHAREIEVFLSSHSPGNVFHHGEKAPLDMGLYCETVMSTRRKLVVPNSLKDPHWDHNPDIKLGMISYCGVPLTWPNGEIFGTICILDKKENAFTQQSHHLMDRFRDSIQLSIASIYQSSLARHQKEEAESQLRTSETRSQRYLDTTQTMVLALDATGCVTMLNRAGQALLGYTEAELLGRNWFATCLSQPEGLDTLYPVFQRIMAGELEAFAEYENVVVCRDGRQRPIGWHNSPFRDDAGRIVGTLSCGEDITERKRGEEALHTSEAKHRLLFESAGDAIFIHDEAGRMLAVNPSACKRLGYTHAELMAMTVNQVDSPADAPHAPERIARLMEQGQLTFETAHQRKDGSSVLTEVGARRITWDGQPAMMSICRDLTERKQAEVALRESEAKLRSVIDCSPVPFAMNDEQGNITYVNREFTKTFGYHLGDIPTLADWWQKAYPDPTYRDLVKTQWQLRLNKALQEGTDFEPVEVSIRCQDGSQRIAMVGAAALTGSYAGAHIAVLYDITERYRAEEALRTAAAYARSLLEASLDPLVTISAGGKITDVNDASVTVAGVPREQIIGTDFSDYFTEPAKAREGYQRVFSEGFVRDYPLAIRHVSGRVTDVLYNATLYRDAQGLLQGVFAAARDITERKQTETALRESELKFRSLFETAEGAILLFADDRWVDCNAKALSIYGATREQIIGAHPSRFSPPIQPDGRSSEEEAIKKINLALTVGPQFFEWEHCRVDGTPFAAEVSLNRLDLQGKPQLQAIVHDITERKQAVEDLRHSEERYRSILNATPYGIAIMDTAGRLVMISPGAVGMFGYKRAEELLGKWFADFIVPEDRARAAFNVGLLFEGKSPGLVEYRCLRADGSPFDVESKGEVIRDAAGQRVQMVAIVRDITKRKQIEEEVKRKNSSLTMLHQLSHALNILSSTAEIPGRVSDMVSHVFDNRNLYIALYYGAQLN